MVPLAPKLGNHAGEMVLGKRIMPVINLKFKTQAPSHLPCYVNAPNAHQEQLVCREI